MAETGRLNLSKVRPPSFASSVTNPRLKTKAANTPSATSFKNPLLGIEVNLIRGIMENDRHHKVTSKRKKKMLFDAIEDVAALDAEFGHILRDVVEQFRPPEIPENIFIRTAVFSDLNQSMSKFKDLSRSVKRTEQRIASIRQEIERLKRETIQVQQETELIKSRIFSESDHFARERNISQRITKLERQYQSIFIKEKPPDVAPELRALLIENERLRREKEVKRRELDFISQISKRMKLLESH